MTTYDEFIDSKSVTARPAGFDVDRLTLWPSAPAGDADGLVPAGRWAGGVRAGGHSADGAERGGTGRESTGGGMKKQEQSEIREGWHRHPNGGGWVEDTATVDAGAWVGPLGIASGHCWVGPKARIRGGVIRGGEIWGGEIWGGVIRGGEIWGGEIRGGEIWGGEIRGGVIWGGVIRGGVIRGGEIRGGEIRGGEIRGGEISGGVIEESPLQIQGTRYFVTETHEGKIQIGCTEMTLAEWRDKGAALARSEKFTPAQVEEYGVYLDLFERLRPALSAASTAETEAADVR